MSWKPELRVGLVSLAAIIAADGLTKIPSMNFLFGKWYLEIIVAVAIIVLVERYLKS